MKIGRERAGWRARCTAESPPVPVASRRSPSERVDVVGGQVGAEPQEAQRVPVSAGLEGAVGGHFDDDVRMDTGDVERAAAEMSGADAGRPWMFTGGCRGQDGGQLLGLPESTGQWCVRR